MLVVQQKREELEWPTCWEEAENLAHAQAEMQVLGGWLREQWEKGCRGMVQILIDMV